eukprot:126297-Pelagomonas_calceolata.AAC.4
MLLCNGALCAALRYYRYYYNAFIFLCDGVSWATLLCHPAIEQTLNTSNSFQRNRLSMSGVSSAGLAKLAHMASKKQPQAAVVYIMLQREKKSCRLLLISSLYTALCFFTPFRAGSSLCSHCDPFPGCRMRFASKLAMRTQRILFESTVPGARIPKGPSLIMGACVVTGASAYGSVCHAHSLEQWLTARLEAQGNLGSFISAMADSSVGGSGLPRPYGRFIGERAGDGKALVSAQIHTNCQINCMPLRKCHIPDVKYISDPRIKILLTQHERWP